MGEVEGGGGGWGQGQLKRQEGAVHELHRRHPAQQAVYVTGRGGVRAVGVPCPQDGEQPPHGHEQQVD